MRWITVLSLLIVCFVCLTVAQVPFEDCCLKYVKKLNQRVQRHITSFRHQEMDGGCNIRAVIFTSRRGRLYCADPNEKWVKDLIDNVKKRNRSKSGRRHVKG